MNINYECLPCLSKQAVKLACKVTDNEELQKKIIKFGLEKISENAFIQSAPYVTAEIYKFGKEISGVRDPFEKEKKEFNIIAAKLIRDMNLEEKINTSKKAFDVGMRLSIAGNIIDFSLGKEINKKDVENSITESLKTNIFGSTSDEFLKKINKAKKILFLADNSGEIVFDKLFINCLPKDKITYVVKGGPIVNDATMEDADFVGMNKLVKVMDNGASIQGTILNRCSNEFLEEFEKADLIISKGQANYETLSEVSDTEIFFLLRAKCMSIAEDIGCELNEFVVLNNNVLKEK